MKIKNILIVGILFLGLLTYILKFEVPSAERKEAERKPFIGSAKAQLISLDVAKPSDSFKLVNSKPKARAEKSDEQAIREMQGVVPDEWNLEGIVGSQIDSTNLNGVITQLFAYELGEPLPASEIDKDLSLYGLDKPEMVLVAIRLSSENSQQQLKFEFGKKSDYLGKRYVRYTRADGTNDLFLTDDLLFFALNKPVKDFRRKEPISFADADLSKVELSGSAQLPNLVFEKKDSNLWKITAPQEVSADQAKISAALRNLRSLKVKEYYDSDSSKEAATIFANPLLNASLDFKDSTKKTLKVSVASEQVEGKEKFYFRVEGIPTVFEAETNATAGVFNDVFYYRQKKYFGFEIDDVQSIDWSGSNHSPLAISKKDEQWMIADKMGDDAFIRQWLTDLNDLEAQAFPSESKDFGFSSPIHKLTLKLKDGLNEGKESERVLIVGDSPDGGKSYYVGVDSLTEPFIISAESLQKITPKVETLVVIPTATPTPTKG